MERFKQIRLCIFSVFLHAQWGKRCWEDREHQAAAKVSFSDESKLSRYSSFREDNQGGAGPRPEQVLYKYISPGASHYFNV